MKRDRKVRCPVCGKGLIRRESPGGPFCSERCKLIDLGEWLSEGYRIKAPLDDESETELPTRREDKR